MLSETTTAVVRSILVPAIVAAIVALAVEYAAKPALEARKERLLRRQRVLWDLRDALAVLIDRLDSIETWTRRQDLELGELVALEREIDLGRVDIRAVQDFAAKASSWLPPAIWSELSFAYGRHQTMFAVADGVARATPPPERLPHYGLAFLNVGSNYQLSLDYLSSPRWRRIRLRRILQRAAERDRWRDVHIPDEDEDQRLLILAEGMVRALGEDGARAMLDALEQPGDAWVSLMSKSSERALLFALMMDVDPSNERTRTALAKDVRRLLAPSA
jgi:hypothetical protein